ncbi:hypothetical protein HY634_04360 [Candidatus Uhrbacteria bacterium]|nr:hypothetical protein [Candidatus Uhrbacteria bacterium]
MTELTQNQRSFIQSMKKSRDHERHGFSLLVKRENSDTFFDALRDEGFFAADRNPEPVVVDAGGSVNIPYWPALDYLMACAERSAARNDCDLAQKVMTVVREVSTGHAGGIRDNFQTSRKFAELIGVLPRDVVLLDDIPLVRNWLGTRFNHGMVAHALDEKALPAFIASEDGVDWAKAVEILRHCTEMRWESSMRGLEETEPVPVVESYWLNELLQHHAAAIGSRAPAEIAKVLEERVREVFSHGREDLSYIVRPAVEEHSQNHSWDGLENAVVAGLRDVVLAWRHVDDDQAKGYVRHLLKSESEMLRRIGLHVLAERWSTMQALYTEVVGPGLFRHGHIHELYDLLKRRFEAFDDTQKAETLEAIRHISQPEGEDSEHHLRMTQLRWLSALSDSKYEPAATWLNELIAKADISVPSHPDFNTYIEVSTGPGPSVYQVPELVAFAEAQNLVEKLNAFQPSEAWHGPSIDALVEALQKAVEVSPETFLDVLPTFLDAARPYQHGLIRGFKTLWDSSKEKPTSFPWDMAWPRLIEFFQALTVARILLGKAPEDRRYDGWIVSAVADFLAAGTRTDDHAFDESLLPRTFALIRHLLRSVKPSASPDAADHMSAAINTPRGRCIEALFAHALRSCRTSDRRVGSHDRAWADMQPAFDDELHLLEDSNFEFATLAGAYLANLDYLSRDWVGENLARLFPPDRPAVFACAVSGLAFSRPTRYLYVLLRDAGVIDTGLSMNLRGRDTRKKLVERIVLAYLWDEETLDSPRVLYSFTNNAVDDLEDAAWFFWAIRRDTLSDGQLQKILDYWAACVKWATTQPQQPTKLFNALGHLAWAMKTADGENQRLLLAVAPHMLHHNIYDMLSELIRLVDVSPRAVGDVLRAVVEAGRPLFDYEDRLKVLIRRLNELGQRGTALHCCNRLIALPGMTEVFKDLIRDA